MHFIQNSWFVVYGVWLLVLLIGTIGIISYINNRSHVLKRITIYFILTFITALSLSLNTDQQVFVPRGSVGISGIEQDNNNVESPSILNNAFRFLGSLIRDKISN